MEIAACDAYRPDWQRWTTFGLERSVGVRDRFAGVAPARSSTRCARPPTATACSTCSRTRRAARCCACSSSTSAPSASARASATTCVRTPTATPRPATCGTPSRTRRGEPVRRIMDSWIWQPGYPLVSARARRRPTRARPAPLHVRRRGRRAIRCGRSRSASGTGTRSSRVLLDGDEARLADRRGRGRRQRRRARLLPRGLQRRTARTDHRFRSRRDVDARALQPGRRRLERSHRRRHGRDGMDRPRRALRRRARVRRVAEHRHRPARSCAG